MFKVLLVEDEVTCSSSVHLLLKDFCQLHSTSSSGIALNLAAANKYDLIIIDIDLHSKTEGVNTASAIRRLTNYTSIPIVAFSINECAEKRQYILSNGYSHFISEPFNIRNFAQQIKFILSSQVNYNNSSPLLAPVHTFIPKVIY
ncbi:MAG: response regulator [Bacteroidetes bacterium]|nr:response regulator [Bacteroidota bacterium]